MSRAAILIFVAAALWAQEPDPAYPLLTKAFEAQRKHDFDAAVRLFRDAAAVSPGRTDIRKNLAYTLLQTGDTELARAEFGEAMRIDPADYHVALEYAFLCFEARDDAPARKAEARRIFARIRDTGDAESRATATAAFNNIDEPLRLGIERWKQALASSKPNFSAYYELAQLAEQRDELELAAASYRSAFGLLPSRRSLLLELARAERARNHTEGAIAALIAASRGSEPRSAELAREQLPERYPYVYEFRQAIELDPSNSALHKELGYLLLSMSESGKASREDAEHEFAAAVAEAKDDSEAEAQLGLLYLADHRTDLAMPLLNHVLASDADAATKARIRQALHLPAALEPRPAAVAGPSKASNAADADAAALGQRSYDAGYLQDALRYFSQAREANPQDSTLALKLAWTNNLLHDDVTALHWFELAARSSNPAVASEARRAVANLRPEQRRFRTTLWAYPLFSSRWGDLFGYGQIKTELRVKKLPMHPYASIRYAGDVRRYTGGPIAQALSESAFITSIGAASDTRRGFTGWFEAGIASGYLSGQHWSDYRGGISYARTLGASLTADRSGLFFETTADSVYISHFGEDLLNYTQFRLGYSGSFRDMRAQVFWNQNVTFDVKRQYWANFIEMGPGVRFRLHAMPPPMWLNVSVVRGFYLRNEGNPGRAQFNDFRIGIWYAFTR